jgi:hypothetical protein
MKKLVTQGLERAGTLIRRGKRVFVVTAALGATSLAAHAGTDATAITAATSTAFVDIATLCVSIGTFFVVYRLVKRIR